MARLSPSAKEIRELVRDNNFETWVVVGLAEDKSDGILKEQIHFSSDLGSITDANFFLDRGKDLITGIFRGDAEPDIEPVS